MGGPYTGGLILASDCFENVRLRLDLENGRTKRESKDSMVGDLRFELRTFRV
jgi:hypothetical protein